MNIPVHSGPAETTASLQTVGSSVKKIESFSFSPFLSRITPFKLAKAVFYLPYFSEITFPNLFCLWLENSLQNQEIRGGQYFEKGDIGAGGLSNKSG